MRSTIAVIVIVWLGIFSAEAQSRRSTASITPKLEDLPRRPVDTLSTGDEDTKIVIYSNNTWSYYRPGLREKYGVLPVFNEYWDSTHVFAYRSIELKDLPSVTELKLVASLSEFNYPVTGSVYSRYGKRGRSNHNGVDVPLKTGEPIHSTFDGKVRYSRYNSGGFGNLVIVRHINGLETWYAHLSKRNVESGDYVKAGDIIGYGGSTGRSRGPHLHYEIRYCDQTFDPERLVDFEAGNLKCQTFALEKSFFNIYSRASDQLEEYDDFGNLASTEGSPAEGSAASQSSARVTASANSGPVYHTVRSGDILSKIAPRYGVSIDQICRLNNITRTSILSIGKRLRIK